MCYCKYYCNHHHLSLVVKTCQAVVLTAAPSVSEVMLRYLTLFSLWLGTVLALYTAFLHQSYFFSLTWAMMGHLSALLLLSVLCHCLQTELERIWPGKSRHCVCWERGTAQYVLRKGGGLPAAFAWHISDTPTGSDCICWTRSGGFLQIRAIRWSHRRWIFTQLTCILFYCQIIITILANITKNSNRLQLLGQRMFLFLTWNIITEQLN